MNRPFFAHVFFKSPPWIIGLALIVCGSYAYAQNQENHWYFGNMAALDFGSGSPVTLLNSQMFQPEGVSSISDDNGNLLFYTNGVNVWNAAHAVMPNGTGLAGQTISAQSALTVRMPGSDSLYYIFTVSDWQNGSGSLRYSLVDMSLNTGLGDVTMKNTLINPDAREQIAAVRHTNCRDIWILSHERNNSDFVAYLLMDTGLVTTPVVSSTGMAYTGGNRYGYLKPSNDGSRLCAATGGAFSTPTVQLFNFDRSTGVVSYDFTIATNGALNNAYSCEFSPDDSKLYVTAFNGTFVNQYDLSLVDSNLVVGSVQDIASTGGTKSCVQLAPDGRIYVSLNGSPFLGVIQSPNAAGVASNYQHNAVDLSGNSAALGLPHYVRGNTGSVDIGSDTTLCSGEVLVLDATQAGATYLWQNNSTDSTFTVTMDGTYWVEVTRSGCVASDTVDVTYVPTPTPDLGPDTSVCQGTVLILDPSTPGASHLWQDNSTDDTLVVTGPGIYWVQTSAGSCSGSDTIQVTYVIPPGPNLGPDTGLCTTDTLVLDASRPGATYRWQDNSTDSTFTVTGPGTYWVEVSSNGCIASDTIRIAAEYTPIIDLGNDTVLCDGQSLVLRAADPGAGYEWQNGQTTNTFFVDQPGLYWVRATAGPCSITDSIRVDYLRPASLDLGPDTTLCTPDSLILQVGIPGVTHLWQDNSSDSTRVVNASGLYWVEVTNGTCTYRDSVNVNVFSTPTVDLGPDTLLCLGQRFRLNASFPGATYQWVDGSTEDDLTVTGAGRFYVEVAIGPCLARDSITVQAVSCSDLQLPNVITPNGDGLNDTFIPISLAEIAVLKTRIYNRWGILVFESENLGIGWDATSFAGTQVSDGTYFWTAEYITTSGQSGTQTGTVIVLR